MMKTAVMMLAFSLVSGPLRAGSAEQPSTERSVVFLEKQPVLYADGGRCVSGCRYVNGVYVCDQPCDASVSATDGGPGIDWGGVSRGKKVALVLVFAAALAAALAVATTGGF
jgi:hypothetical protein